MYTSHTLCFKERRSGCYVMKITAIRCLASSSLPRYDVVVHDHLLLDKTVVVTVVELPHFHLIEVHQVRLNSIYFLLNYFA